MLLGGLLGAAVFLIAFAIWGRPEMFATRRTALEAFRQVPHVLVSSLVASQVGIGLVAYLSARMSPVPWRERLSLRRPALDAPTLVAMVVASAGFTLLGVLIAGVLQILGVLPEIGTNRQELARLFLSLPGAWAVATIACASLLPGVSEELLYRGFVQTGLLAHWRPWLAIAASAVLFAGAHADLSYAVFTLPDGVWLGYLAWRTRSVLPGMLCHAATNAGFQSVGHVLADPADLASQGRLDLRTAAILLAIVAATTPACVYVVRRLRRQATEPQRTGAPTEVSAPASMPDGSRG